MGEQVAPTLKLTREHRQKYREWYEDLLIEATAWAVYRERTEWF